MKKLVLTASMVLGSMVAALSQNLPSATSIENNAKVSNASKLTSFIKSSLQQITPQQESQIMALASKVDLGKTSNSKDQVKTLLSNPEFTKIFSAIDLEKLKSAVSK
jgi:hypothetical protein